MVVATAGILYVSSWAYVAASPWLFDTFYGEHGIVTTLERSPNAVAAVQDGFAANMLVYAVILGLFALLCGVAVFVVMGIIRRGYGVLRTVRAGSSFERHEQLERAMVRVIVLVLWALYILATVNILVPLCVLGFRIGVEEMGGWQGVLLSGAAGAALLLVLHVHVISLRLAYLRPRVYGGEVLVESALINS